MLRTFNCGIGMVVVVAPGKAPRLSRAFARRARTPVALGHIVAIAAGERVAFAGRLALVTIRRKRTAVLISGRGSNMQALIERARDPGLSGRNRPRPVEPAGRGGLAFAQANGVACAAVDHKIYAGREEFERSMQALLELHRIEIICLAGFMRLLTPWFIGQWQGRLLNIHPALLPAYRGLKTHERALADGVKIHGCTVHFVTPAMDEGPIVAQAAVAVLDCDTPDTLAARVLAQEHAHLSGRARPPRRRPPAGRRQSRIVQRPRAAAAAFASPFRGVISTALSVDPRTSN